MSNYIYTCACCGTQWDRTSTGRKPTKLERSSMVCQPCRMARWRIAELEAEAQRWRKAHDKIIAYAADVEERAKESIAEAAAESAALREDKARLDWLEQIGFSTRHDTFLPGHPLVKSGVHSRRAESGEWMWTARWISSEFKTARAAIDAARKESR